MRKVTSYKLILMISMIGLSSLTIEAWSNPAVAQEKNYQITVNSDGDDIQSDRELTLREAIAIVNGTIPLSQLSDLERSQVQIDTNNSQGSQIRFNLPSDRTTIKLKQALPDLNIPNLSIDGTTQTGYDSQASFAQELAIPQPIVAIAPADGVEIWHGFTIVADGVTIKGLSLYGFNNNGNLPPSPPSADIFISQPVSGRPPQGVVLETNWLGITPTGAIPQQNSGFGVYLFNSTDALIRSNRIANHGGSGIITSVRATGTQIIGNAITSNGFNGMPHGIYLEGEIANLKIQGNTICANDGSGIYLFKPNGAIRIEDNRIIGNSRSTNYAAIYLMGNDHQVTNNQITHQRGAGVAIAAFPKSDRNLIRKNTFTALSGLSIDLISQNHVADRDFVTGDGINTKRDSYFRRVDTANGAIDAPTFLASDFPMFTPNQVNIDGIADPDTEIDLYRVKGKVDDNLPYGSLSEYLTTVKTNANGKFGATLTNLQVGDTISAIATDPQYGTSEPALNARIVNADLSVPTNVNSPIPAPACTTPPQVVQVPPDPPVPIILSVPRQVHFALDRDDISVNSAKVLDRVADVLKQYSTIMINLVGHTDPRASDEYNRELGFRRSLSVRNYLMRQGVPSERMTVLSLGETQRSAQGDRIIDYASDRRVEIEFTDVRDVEIKFENQKTDLQLEN
ncbi:right-handed parallel beta-helix repeat-containing protein [Pseudanabaena mucicola]|uniref:Right-handed parallel beta-helix repeat-containing protein n=1 Tax=Pseudanabaena mucicola FACHB-723 TaxID=2692860 RepID=A0ABR8A138_9CYAN|nr:right-handed parallel beta-helix repeat-containing protein [Pseudanabaena mucicola]MBD2189072.1 right-handed parallel beta-helix repeat-containing protein [Pseudanabaena mucicola FACHB-723]